MKLLQVVLTIFILSGCATTMELGDFKLVQKRYNSNKELNTVFASHDNSKGKTGESCNWGFFLPATGEPHNFRESLNSICPDSNSIRDVKIYEKLRYYLLYNEVCTVTEGICIE